MPFYKIYAGLGGGLGGQVYIETIKAKDQDEATTVAYQTAYEEYESMAGMMHGLMDYNEAMDEATSEVDFSDFEDDNDEYDRALQDKADEIYNESVENWIEYEAIETENLTDTDNEDK